MLSQIVRPLVQTQIRLLANSQKTRETLLETVSRWLSYLGVRACVTHLAPQSDKIHVCLSVSKPESCDASDWQKILQHLEQSPQTDEFSSDTYDRMSLSQQNKLARLLAYLIQAGTEQPSNWDEISPQLERLNLDKSILAGIKSALKVPQSPDQLLKGLEPDLAAIALPIAVSIVWLDRSINQKENSALMALLEAMK
ncbi:MAG: hypothetical protein IGR93_07665 [Hydrococcus sp. C42_A2020_068]|uniref:hypothetical protein n=1 Tax=Pleurocapsa sp. PCC 7327 TaxID=118163 RepID=UPI00029F994E|nr:hypothetical protein [Pleurocapsa sp. PCC 7327]AFY78169.1 hypothetical protein Ple7327_2929 [Pleurocapsa sp. PCC 7327]MBF2019967.1 hypothetical protein [Hydrococcus sp. C42_A2020_068]